MKKLFSDRSAWWSLFLEVVRVTVPLQFLLNILAWTMSTSNPTFAPLSCPKPQTCLPWCDIHTAATSPPTPFSPLPAISPSPPHPSSSSSSSYSSRFSSFSSAAAAMYVLRWVHACTQEQREKTSSVIVHHCLLYFWRINLPFQLDVWPANPEIHWVHTALILEAHTSHPDFVMWVLRIEVKLLRNY